jgi:hypothetical protein
MATKKRVLPEVATPHDKEPHNRQTNALKVRIDDLRTFQPLTDNQKIFFDAYKQGDYFVDMCQLRLDRVFKVTGNQAYIDFLNSRRIANNEFVGDTSTRRQFCKVESIANTHFDVNQLAVEDNLWFLEERVKSNV